MKRDLKVHFNLLICCTFCLNVFHFVPTVHKKKLISEPLLYIHDWPSQIFEILQREAGNRERKQNCSCIFFIISNQILMFLIIFVVLFLGNEEQKHHDCSILHFVRHLLPAICFSFEWQLDVYCPRMNVFDVSPDRYEEICECQDPRIQGC